MAAAVRARRAGTPLFPILSAMDLMPRRRLDFLDRHPPPTFLAMGAVLPDVRPANACSSTA
jgi:hypothetical protein